MSNLGKPKPHSTKQIRERREKVLILMSKGFNQSDIAKELHTTRNTVMRDIKEIKEWTKKGLLGHFDLNLWLNLVNHTKGSQ